MKCRKCSSMNTRVTVTEHHGHETWRYCRCLECKCKFKTIETYAIQKSGPVPGYKPKSNCIKYGVENGWSVLTEDNVRTIRRLADEEANYNDIAQKFGIHKNTVYRIVKRQLWSHI